ncbi:MAG: hypothetical protein K9M57_07865 [Phycisphaerae bacterium]|nr:hypothetical protein [Phycisphaerae bacterium]
MDFQKYLHPFICVNKLPPKVADQPLDGGPLSGLKGQSNIAQGKRSQRSTPWVQESRTKLSAV